MSTTTHTSDVLYYDPFFVPPPSTLEKLLEDKKRAKIEECSKSALDVQIAGSHYKDFKIQPFEFFHANQLPFHKSDIIKRIMRYDLPTGKGLQDLEKIKHEVDMIIELEGYKK